MENTILCKHHNEPILESYLKKGYRTTGCQRCKYHLKGYQTKTHCINGHEYTPENSFYKKRNGRKDGRECRICQRERQRTLRLTDPERIRGYDLKRGRGVTVERYKLLFQLQKGLCAACLEPKKLVVDHDHKCCPSKRKQCGKCVRALLCHNCNSALGHVQDSPSRLRALADYLERYEISNPPTCL